MKPFHGNPGLSRKAARRYDRDQHVSMEQLTRSDHTLGRSDKLCKREPIAESGKALG